MIYFVGIGIIALIAIVVIQIGKLSELSAKIKGEEAVELSNNNTQAKLGIIFLILFLGLTIYTAFYYKNEMFPYGPLKSASEHGFAVDRLFNITLVATGFVFILTHILLFWFTYKYRMRDPKKKALFYVDNLKLEMVWTLIPLVVFVLLVSQGISIMNDIFRPLTDEDKYLEIEATGYQFAWDIRYPGDDGKLGNKDFRLIDPASNSIGIDWNDEKSLDDIVLGGTDKIVIPKDTLVRIRITAKDVLHSFFLPHFRVKLDAVPGMPTFFAFKPVKTTKEFKEELKKYPEWNEPADPKDPTGPKRWEVFEYELACAELCGKGHYSMRRVVEVVERDEYESWLKEQKSFYYNNIRGTEADPWDGKKLFPNEIKARAEELSKEISDIMSSTENVNGKIILLKHVFYETGSDAINNKLSRYELDNLVELLNKYPSLRVELAGHTDNVGDDAANITLSENRASNVKQYLLSKNISATRLTSKGYGEMQPLESNDSADGRRKNRRTELRVISK